MVLEHDGFGSGCGLGLAAEQRYHRLRVVVGTVGVVERVEQRHLSGSCEADVAQFFLCKETL